MAKDGVRVGIYLVRSSHDRLGRLSEAMDTSQSGLIDALLALCEDPEFPEFAKRVKARLSSNADAKEKLNAFLEANPGAAAAALAALTKKK